MPEVGQILIMEWKLCMEINNRRLKMIIRYDIKPKSDNEYKDVIDGISDFLDRNNIEHRKTEILDESGQDKIANSQNKQNKAHYGEN